MHYDNEKLVSMPSNDSPVNQRRETSQDLKRLYRLKYLIFIHIHFILTRVLSYFRYANLMLKKFPLLQSLRLNVIALIPNIRKRFLFGIDDFERKKDRACDYLRPRNSLLKRSAVGRAME